MSALRVEPAPFRGDRTALAAALRAERGRRRGIFPLSHAQTGLWLLDRADPGTPAYNISRAVRWTGRLDEAALQMSIASIVARHASLRTIVGYEDDRPVQVVAQTRPVDIRRLTLRGMEPAARDAAFRRALADEATYRYDLEKDAALRVLLIRFAPDEQVLQCTFHHIYVDERSLAIFYAELRERYAALVTDAPLPERPPPLSYGEYALRARAKDARDPEHRQLAYWASALAGAPETIALPYARPRPAERRFRGASMRVALEPRHVRTIAEIARDVEVTPFATYLAAFFGLLNRSGAGDDLVVGTPISKRDAVDVESTIGFFANAVALRVACAGDPTFSQLVRRVREATLGAFAHCDVPFQRVVAATARRRDAGANPIFQVMFAIQPEVGAALELPGIASEPVELARDVAKFDLTALVLESPSGTRIELNYDTDIIDASTVAEMAARFLSIFETLARDANTRLSALCESGEGTRVSRCVASEPKRASPPRSDAESMDERRALERRLCALWESVLGVAPVAVDDDFFAIGGHSLLAVRMVERMERELGLRVPLSTLFAEPTVAYLAAVLTLPSDDESPAMLRPIVIGTNATPVVFFHGNFLGGSHARTIAKRLGDRTVYSFAPHGSDGEPVPATFELMGADALARLRAAGLEPPYDFVGYCNGAIVALEVGRLLEAQGFAPPRIFAIEAEVNVPIVERTIAMAHRLGALGLREPARDMLVHRLLFRYSRLSRIASVADLRRFVGTQLRSVVDAVRGRPISERHRESEAGSADTFGLLQIYRDRALHYRARPYRGRIAVMRALEKGRRRADVTVGWSGVSQRVDVHWIAGCHVTSVTTHAISLADRLRKLLND